MADNQFMDDASEEDDDKENETEDFAKMLESYEAGRNDDIRVGDKIRGRVISISDSAVFVDTGTKADGVVEKEELLDDKGELQCAVGDTLELYVVAADESEVRLSRAIAGIGGLNMLKDAQAGGIPVEGKVRQVIKGGFQVEVLKRRAFCPISQIDTVFVETPEQYVGQTFPFLIKRITEGGRNIVVSRRDLLEAEQKKSRDAFMKTLETEQVLTGRVTRLMPFGAFVELIPGVEGMVHISELSWSRLDTPDQAVKPGDSVQVKVLRIEPGPKQKKIALSVKQVLGNPWDTIGDDIRVGDKTTGKVTRCAPFGAFVEIRPGVEGLVHISEMSFTQRVLKPEDIVKPGERIAVVVKEIDLSKRRIGLSIRDAQGDPWATVSEKYPAGQKVQGTVEGRESFGVFVALEPGVVGLLPKSEINRAAAGAQVDKLNRGDRITVAVESINLGERKISLKLQDEHGEEDWRSFSKGEGKKSEGNSALGQLGEKLAKAMKSKKE